MEVLYARCCGIRRPQGIAGRLPAAARRPPQAFGGPVIRHHDGGDPALARVVIHGGMHTRRDGIDRAWYWQPVFNLLEGTFGVVLANAHHIKAVPGRKTDVKDCEWLADLLAHGLIRASFIPPAPIRELRDLTRHRKSLIRDRVKAANRVHKLLEGANIKLGNVVSDVLGVSGRAMLNALVAGETDPTRLASLARGSLTPKVKQLAETLRGRFTAHHGFLLGQILMQLDHLAALVASCDARIHRPRAAVRGPDPAPADRGRRWAPIGRSAGIGDWRRHVAIRDSRALGILGAHLS